MAVLALEAVVPQRAGLREALFIAMSNYYFDEKVLVMNLSLAPRCVMPRSKGLAWAGMLLAGYIEGKNDLQSSTFG